jgi:hypothetical protein
MDDLKAPQPTDEEKARVRQYLREQRAALRGPVTPVITIFVRHNPDCKYAGDEFCKRCNCRKHLRWSLGGKQHRKQAGTRSWTEAEEIKRRLEAQLLGDPVKVETRATSLRSALDSFSTAKKGKEFPRTLWKGTGASWTASPRLLKSTDPRGLPPASETLAGAGGIGRDLKS